MIWYIQGSVKDITEQNILIMTSGWVWYEIHINEKTYWNLVWKSETELYIYHNITENNQSLFWFATSEEKKIFSELIKISGVWGKVAQNILSLWAEKLSTAVMLEDKVTIESIKWIGKKMAEKIILELKDKDFIKYSEVEKNTSENSKISPLTKSQIIETLTAMWYNKDQILTTIGNVPESMESVDDILPFVIKNI